MENSRYKYIMENSPYKYIMENSRYKYIMENSRYKYIMENSRYKYIMENSPYKYNMENSRYKYIMENSGENIQKSESSNVESNLLKIINLKATVQKYEAFCQQLIISNRNLNKEVIKLNEDNDEILNSIYNIEGELLRSNQYNRRENLEFVNIPESTTQKELEPLLLKILNSEYSFAII